MRLFFYGQRINLVHKQQNKHTRTKHIHFSETKKKKVMNENKGPLNGNVIWTGTLNEMKKKRKEEMSWLLLSVENDCLCVWLFFITDMTFVYYYCYIGSNMFVSRSKSSSLRFFFFVFFFFSIILLFIEFNGFIFLWFNFFFLIKITIFLTFIEFCRISQVKRVSRFCQIFFISSNFCRVCLFWKISCIRRISEICKRFFSFEFVEFFEFEKNW